MNLHRNKFSALEVLDDFSSNKEHDTDLEYETESLSDYDTETETDYDEDDDGEEGIGAVLPIISLANPANHASSASSASSISVSNVSLGFVNLKPTSIKSRSKPLIPKKIRDFKSRDSKKFYNEMDNLPIDFSDAIRKKQNLTLKQILTLMNLHAIPPMVLNDIHENLQTQVKRRHIKISEFRNFYVSQYKWTDLNKIQEMINSMLDS